MSKQAVIVKVPQGEIIAVVLVDKKELSRDSIKRFDRMASYLDLAWSTHEVEEVPSLEKLSAELREAHGLDDEDLEPTVSINPLRVVTGRISSKGENLANFPKLAWEPCDPSCKGWIHMDEPLEIEACDECGRFNSDDEAIVAHREECGCGYPERDYYAWMCRRINYCIRPQQPVVGDAEACEPVEALLEERNIIPRLPELFAAVTRAIDTVKNPCVKEDLGYFMDVLKEVREKVDKGELSPKDFSEDWSHVGTA